MVSTGRYIYKVIIGTEIHYHYPYTKNEASWSFNFLNIKLLRSELAPPPDHYLHVKLSATKVAGSTKKTAM